MRDMTSMFNGHYLDVRTFYAWQFNRVPCIFFIGELDVSKAASHIRKKYQNELLNNYQHAWYNHEEAKLLFNDCVFVLNEDRIIELSNDYCQVYFTPHQSGWATQVIKELAVYRKTESNKVRVMGFARKDDLN